MISDLELILFYVAEYLDAKDFLNFRITSKLCYNVSNDTLNQIKLPYHCNMNVKNQNNQNFRILDFFCENVLSDNFIKLLYKCSNENPGYPKQLLTEQIVSQIIQNCELNRNQIKLIIYFIMNYSKFYNQNDLEQSNVQFFKKVRFDLRSGIVSIDEDAWKIIKKISNQSIQQLPLLNDIDIDDTCDLDLLTQPNVFQTCLIYASRAIYNIIVDHQISKKIRVIGNQMFKQNDYAKAIQYYSAAFYFNPKDPLILNNRALCYTKMDLFYHSSLDALHAMELGMQYKQVHQKSIYNMIEAALKIKMNLYYDVEPFITEENLQKKWKQHQNTIESYDDYDFLRIYQRIHFVTLDDDNIFQKFIIKKIRQESQFISIFEQIQNENLSQILYDQNDLETLFSSNLGFTAIIEEFKYFLYNLELNFQQQSHEWSDKFFWVSAFVLAIPQEAIIFAQLIQKRWPKQIKKNTLWNNYLLEASEVKIMKHFKNNIHYKIIIVIYLVFLNKYLGIIINRIKQL